MRFAAIRSEAAAVTFKATNGVILTVVVGTIPMLAHRAEQKSEALVKLGSVDPTRE